MHNPLHNLYPLVADQAAMTYLDDYLLLESEHQKHDSLYNEKPNYPLILQTSLNLLAQGSGHFLVIVSVSNALLQTQQWAGFAESLIFLNQLFAEKWPELFPPPDRIKGRAQMLDWLAEHWHQFIDTHPAHNLNLDFLQKILANLHTLQHLLNQHGQDMLDLTSTIHKLKEAEARIRNEKQIRESQQQAEQERLAQHTFEKALNQHSEIITEEEYLNHLNTEELYAYASKRLSTENLAQLNDTSRHYAIFKHHRTLAWWGPTHHSHLLDWQEFSEALRLKTEQNYLTSLIALETLFLKQPLFLDLQFHLCDCLESLDAEPQLIEMLKHECQEFCARHPELEQTKINGIIPAFNKQTRCYFGLFDKQKKA